MWNAFGWIMSTAIIVLVIFGHYPFTQSDIHTEPIHFASFLGVSRVMWAVAVSYIIFACHHSYGGPLNMLLSLSLWQPLSRLTYAIYITHNFVIFMIMATVRFPLYFSNISMVGKHFTKIHSLTYLMRYLTFWSSSIPVLFHYMQLRFEYYDCIDILFVFREPHLRAGTAYFADFSLLETPK